MNRGKTIRAANFEINKDQSKGKAVSASKRDAVFATKGQKYSQNSMNREKKIGKQTLKLIKINQKERLCLQPREMLCSRPRDREINESEKKFGQRTLKSIKINQKERLC
jgi:hypothetical protein